MMVVRASLAATDNSSARLLSRGLCTLLNKWGRCEILKLEPSYKLPGEFSLNVTVAVEPRGDPIALVRDIAGKLASGPWEFHEADPEEAWAVWDVARSGGTAAVRGTTWLCVELLPAEGTRQEGSEHPPQ